MHWMLRILYQSGRIEYTAAADERTAKKLRDKYKSLPTVRGVEIQQSKNKNRWGT